MNVKDNESDPSTDSSADGLSSKGQGLSASPNKIDPGESPQGENAGPAGAPAQEAGDPGGQSASPSQAGKAMPVEPPRGDNGDGPKDTSPPGSGGPGNTVVNPLGILLLLLYLLSFVGVLFWGLVQVWSEITAAQPTTQQGEPQPAPPLGGPSRSAAAGDAQQGSGGKEERELGINLYGLFPVSGRETLLLIAVALAGAIGATVHTLRSFYWYVGNRMLKRSWIPLYVLRPVVGSVLAVIFYLVIRGGFFSPSAESTAVSPLGFTALAGLVGMFSEQAVLKLREIANTVFTRPPEGEDAKAQNNAAEAGKQ